MEYLGIQVGTSADIFLTPLFFFIFYALFKKYKNKNDLYEFKVFKNGLLLKLISAIVLPLIYIFYYEGGDTITYMRDSLLLRELFFEEPSIYFDFLFNGMFVDDIRFDYKYYWEIRSLDLPYICYRLDDRSFFVVRFASVFAIISGGSFIVTGMFIALFCYLGTWKLYKLFVEYYPVFKKQLSYTILFIPSVVFWGSGVLKDPITMGALCFLMVNFHNVFKKRKIYRSILLCVFHGFLLMSIKPYIINAFFIGMGCWLLSNYLVKIKSVVFKTLVFPILLTFFGGVVYIVMTFFSEETGPYSMDNVLDEAVLVQQDLKQDYYGGHRFDIGDFEPTAIGVLSKAPIAIATTLFRPFIWEARNIFVMISAFESTVIIVFTLLAFFRIKIFNLQSVLFQNPLLFFSFVFSLFFAFSIGLTTANFGALVRYKIPLMPFYLSMVYILSNYSKLPKK